MEDIYILINDEPNGPFSSRQIQDMVTNGEVNPQTLYATSGSSGWQPLSLMLPGAAQTSQPPAAHDIQYDQTRLSELLEAHNHLCTYTAAHQWDEQALAEITKIKETLAALNEAIAHASAALDQATRDLEQESFLKRTFGSHKSHEAGGARLWDLQQRKVQMARLAEQLHTAIDLTPRSAQERNLLLKELRLRKKELQIRKRETSAAATAIRQEARGESARAGKTWLGFYDPELAAAQRREIRYAKEAALHPHEDAKAAIGRQLLQIEKNLLWVERFS